MILSTATVGWLLILAALLLLALAWWLAGELSSLYVLPMWACIMCLLTGATLVMLEWFTPGQLPRLHL